MTEQEIKEFVREWDESIKKAVMKDDFTAARAYCEKYGIPIPENEDVFKAGIYKAASGCISLSDAVKKKAAKKAKDLGFHPAIWGW